MLDDVHAGAVSPYVELFNSCRTECIRRRYDYLLALRLEIRRKLAYRGGLACAVDAYHHDNRRLCVKLQLVVAGEHFRNDVAQELLDVRGVGGASALYSLAKFVAYLHGGLSADIGKDQRFLQLVEKVLVYLREAVHQQLQLAHEAVLRLLQAVFQLLKESLLLRSFFGLLGEIRLGNFLLRELLRLGFFFGGGSLHSLRNFLGFLRLLRLGYFLRLSQRLFRFGFGSLERSVIPGLLRLLGCGNSTVRLNRRFSFGISGSSDFGAAAFSTGFAEVFIEHSLLFVQLFFLMFLLFESVKKSHVTSIPAY